MNSSNSRKARLNAKIKNFSSAAVYPFSLSESAILFPEVNDFFCENERISFQKNLKDSVALATTVYSIGEQIAGQKLFQRIYAANRIRAIDPKSVLRSISGDSSSENDDYDEEKDRRILECTLSEFETLVSNSNIPEDNNQYFYFEEVLTECIGLLSDQKMKDRNQLILRSAQAQVWTSLEIFIKDILREAINKFPSLALLLEESPEFKRRFSIPKLTLSDLLRSGFDLNSSCGNFIFESLDFSSIKSIKVVIEALGLNDQSINEKMSSRQLNLIFLKRNLIVHRSGVIDRKYRDLSACDREIGQLIEVVPKEYVADVHYVWSVGESVFAALNSLRSGLSSRD